MLCEAIAELPKDLSGWIAERKIDGVRALYKKGRIFGRNGTDFTDKFPELKADIDAVLDGEIVCEGENFENIQSRVHTKDLFSIRLLSKKYPVIFYVFDILEYEGENVSLLPLMERKAYLDKVVVPARYEKLSYVEGEAIGLLWQEVKANDQEGIVLKRKDSIYVGKRSPAWLKLKNFKEAVLEFTDYEEHPKGILLKDGLGHRVNVNGSQATQVLAILTTTGKVKAEVQYLSYNKETDAYRFPSFRGLAK
jgi:DNA ligase-1